jgi:hypothetical protein
MAAHPVKRALRSVGNEVCPWCEQPIPHEKFEEIQERIRANERARLAEVEARLQLEHEQHIADLAAASEAQVAEIKRKSVADLTAAKAATERDIALAVAEANKKSAAEMSRTIAQAQGRQQVAEQQLKTLQGQQEDVIAARLTEQREALVADKEKALNAERSKAFVEKQKLTEKLAAVQRQLEHKTADDLGEGAEVDLFEELKRAFPDDKIVRVAKGVPGADFIHTVIADGNRCGQIIYDSKNRQAWRNDYVTKLRTDQLAAKADHAVLVSRPFPSGSKQLHVRDGVIVVHPARAVALVQIVREHIVMMAGARISESGRAQKMDALYEFVTSSRCTQLLDQVDRLSDDLLELDVTEKKAHDSTWRKRGELVIGIQQARGNLVSEIGLIINVEREPT